MSTYESASPAISGPADERHSYLKTVALWTFGGMILASVCGWASTFFIAGPVMMMGNGWGGVIVVLGTFFFAHYACRKMVYGGAKLPGFILACIAEGVALGFLLLSTLYRFGMSEGGGIILEALGITTAATLGMLVYAWFSKGELKLIGAFLSIAFLPMIILMVVSFFFPIGGPIGIAVCAVFVVVSAAGLLYRLHYAVHKLGTDQHIEAAYEVTMGVLVLLWNILSLLNRLRR